MRVLQICQDYYNTDLYKNLFNNLEGDITNIVFTPLNLHNKLIKNKKGNIEIYSVPAFNKYDRFAFYKKQNKIYNGLESNIDINNIDIVHAHTLFTSGNIAYNIKKNYGKKYIVAVRNTDVNMFFKYRINLKGLGIEILKEAEKVVFLSGAYKERVIRKYVPNSLKDIIEKKSVVIPNGIDNLWFRNNNLFNKKINNKDINVIQVSRLDKNKNHETTIKAIKKLREQGINIKLHIVGEGSLKKKIIKISNKNKDFITYYGKLDKKEIKKMYSNMDIFIMPSKYETFGLVYVEAMSQGVPIIYTKGQGFDGYFDEGVVGFSVKYNDYNNIKKRIFDIVDNYNNISKQCIIKSKSFLWKDISSRYREIYKELQ